MEVLESGRWYVASARQDTVASFISLWFLVTYLRRCVRFSEPDQLVAHVRTFFDLLLIFSHNKKQKVEAVDRSGGDIASGVCVRRYPTAVPHGQDGHGDPGTKGALARAAAAARELMKPCSHFVPTLLSRLVRGLPDQSPPSS